MTTLKILRDARRLISQGWAQHNSAVRLPDDTIAYCATGAINHSRHLNGIQTASRPHLDAIVLFKRANGIADIPKWNDRPSRTKRDVIAAFDRAITHCQHTVTIHEHDLASSGD